MEPEQGLPRRVLTAALALAMGLGFSFAMGELAIRFWKRDSLVQPDPVTIRSLRPNQQRHIMSFDTEEALTLHRLPAERVDLGIDYSNNLGLRMRRDIGPKEENERRILLLGDSYVAARENPIEDRFYYLMDGALTARTDTEFDWRVVNGAVRGGNPSQYLLMLRGFIPLLEPDLVVLALGGNDLMDDLMYERNHGFEYDTEKIPIRPAQVGRLWVLQKSWLVRFLYQLAAARSSELWETIWPPADASVDVISWQEFYCMATPKSQAAFREKTGKYVRALQEMTRESGAEFVVYMIHYLWLFDDEPFYRHAGDVAWHAEAERYGCNAHDLEPYNSFVEGFLEENRIPFHNSYDRFKREKRARPNIKLWSFDDYHFSAAGHRVVADELLWVLEPYVNARGSR